MTAHGPTARVPASGLITDEIVEKAARAVMDTPFIPGNVSAMARIALEAAAPLIVAREQELHAIATEPCDAETWSWDHFRDWQVDPYWIRCKALGPHDEHEDSDTGLTWKEARRG